MLISFPRVTVSLYDMSRNNFWFHFSSSISFSGTDFVILFTKLSWYFTSNRTIVVVVLIVGRKEKIECTFLFNWSEFVLTFRNAQHHSIYLALTVNFRCWFRTCILIKFVRFEYFSNFIVSILRKSNELTKLETFGIYIIEFDTSIQRNHCEHRNWKLCDIKL